MEEERRAAIEEARREKREKRRRRRKISLVILAVAVIGLGVLIFKWAYGIELLDKAEAAGKEALISQKIADADALAKGYFYDEAIALLLEDESLYDAQAAVSGANGESAGGDGSANGEAGKDGADSASSKPDPILQKVAEIEKLKNSLVKYDGVFEHVFFHSLIVYPELAFDDYGHPAEGYNMWMTTVTEFKRMLPYFYEDGYILYPLNELIENDPDAPGSVKLKDIYLPEGKKPLVISIDDVNYYDYMKPDGFANRLVLGEDGRVWTEVITPQGEVTVTRDGDVMPILDDFVAEHPDFSWRGAKGVIALTGYQGALGYRITDGLPTEAEDQQTVKAIADTLKADGWLFACHSYTHNSYFRTYTVTMEQMQWDTDRWINKIAPWVGETNIYISPFGWQWDNNNKIHRYIAESGYQIFCPVSNARRITTYDDIVVMPRVDLDGYTMTKRVSELEEHYFPVSRVIDEARPAPTW